MSISVLFVAAVAGAPHSGLTPLLPPDAGPLAPFRWLSRVVGLQRLAPSQIPVVGIASVALLGGVFAFAAWQAWRGGLSLRTVIWVGVALHAVFVALPLIISHDAYHYALYGRIVSIHHQNPYVVTPDHFPTDPLFPFFSKEWRNTPALYGPAFVQLAGLATRLIRSPAGLILFFKLLSGAASLATMLLVGRLVRRVQPARAAFAVVLIGWNPVVLVDTIGAGHMDSLIALSIVIAFTLLLGTTADGASRGTSPRDLVVTTVLTVAALLKPTVVFPLMLFIAVRAARCKVGWRLRALALHIGVALLVAVPLLAPFEQRQDPLLGVSYLSKYSTALAPSTFLRTLVRLGAGTRGFGASASDLIGTAFTLLFLISFAVLLRYLAFQRDKLTPLEQGTGWAWVLLLFLLTAPILWPWYLIWLLPLMWATPSGLRVAVVAMSATLPAFIAVAEGEVYPHAFLMSKALAVTLAAPILLGYLVLLQADLAKRVRNRVPITDQRRVLSA